MPSTRVAIVALLALLGASWITPSADAQTPPAEAQTPPAEAPVDETEARALFEAGTVAYDAGRYEAALARFQEAYELTHRPVILWNVALAADRARQDALALENYRRFLAEAPESANTADIRARAVARVGVLEHEVAEAREAAARAEAAEQERARAEAEAAEARAEAEQARTDAQTAVDSARVTNKWWFWTAIGVGVVTAVTVPVVVVNANRGGSGFPATDHGSVIFALSGRF